MDPDALRIEATRALSAGEHRRAVGLYGELVEQEPFDPLLRNALGYALLSLARWSEAETEFRESVTLAPGSGEGYLGLGMALYRQGREAEAARVLQAGLETLPPGTERDGWRRLVEARLPGVRLE